MLNPAVVSSISIVPKIKTCTATDHVLAVEFSKRDVSVLAGNTAGGCLLSQIAYWHSPAKDGTTRLRVERFGQFWIAKTRDEWCEETGIPTVRQHDRVVSALRAKGLIETRIMHFGRLGQTRLHIRLLVDAFTAALELVRSTPKPGTPELPQTVSPDLPQTVSPKYYSTTDSTTKTHATQSVSKPVFQEDQDEQQGNPEQKPVQDEPEQEAPVANADEKLKVIDKNRKNKLSGNVGSNYPSQWQGLAGTRHGKMQVEHNRCSEHLPVVTLEYPSEQQAEVVHRETFLQLLELIDLTIPTLLGYRTSDEDK
jgi:hypothetical protein